MVNAIFPVDGSLAQQLSRVKLHSGSKGRDEHELHAFAVDGEPRHVDALVEHHHRKALGHERDEGRNDGRVAGPVRRLREPSRAGLRSGANFGGSGCRTVAKEYWVRPVRDRRAQIIVQRSTRVVHDLAVEPRSRDGCRACHRKGTGGTQRHSTCRQQCECRAMSEGGKCGRSFHDQRHRSRSLRHRANSPTGRRDRPRVEAELPEAEAEAGAKCAWVRRNRHLRRTRTRKLPGQSKWQSRHCGTVPYRTPRIAAWLSEPAPPSSRYQHAIC